jgi:type IV secretory pathway TraG/TraD family ATPase VirD4
MMEDKINQYIHTHPRQSLQILLMGIFLIWQSAVAVLGLIFYLILSQYYRLVWWQTLLMGVVVAMAAMFFQRYYFNTNFAEFFHQGFSLNILMWKVFFRTGVKSAALFIFTWMWNYTIGFPLLMAGILDLINLIPENSHQHAMNALKKGINSDASPEISNAVMSRALKKLSEVEHDGTVLGVSKYNGNYLIVPDKDINQVLLVLGTTGGGKTITLRRFYKRAITQGYPLVIVDGKPDENNIEWLRDLAKQHGRRFIGFNCGNYLPYDPLANGGYTELKDKIICLKDEWSSDHYRSIAEDYLQTTLEVLIKSKRSFDLRTVVDCLNYEELAMLVRETDDPVLMKRVSGLEQYDRKDITGLQAHLNILIHSELGQFFEKNETTFTLLEAIEQNAVVYFALPALRFPSFSKVLGKLVVNDLKAVVDRTLSAQRIFTVFDEFSVFAGEQVLNLVNMGRGKGVHAIFGTQGLADLDKVDVTFKNQVLNCANTIICHRVNDQETAETVVSWVGTKDVFTVTAQINMKEGDAAMGTVRRNKEFIIHPDDIKQGLQTGEAFYITKIGKFRQDKIKVKYL